MELTEFGKVVRKLRIDRAMSLKDMADALQVSSAYLSAVETGRKSLSSELVGRISGVLDASSAERSSLERSASEAVAEVRIRSQRPETMALVMAFARKIEDGTLKMSELERLLEK